MKLQDNIAAEFNEFAKTYTKDMIACVPHYLELMASFTQDIPKGLDPKRILDLGCGNGNVSAELLKEFPQAHYTLLDASDKMLELCQMQFKDNSCTAVQSYFQDFDFKNHAFDMVAAGFSVHHCNKKEKEQLFKNIHDALDTGGVFSCSDLMIDRDTKEHQDLITKWKVFVGSNFSDEEKWNWLMDHYNEFDNPDSLKDHLTWLENAGFTDFKIIIRETYWVHLKAYKS